MVSISCLAQHSVPGDAETFFSGRIFQGLGCDPPGAGQGPVLCLEVIQDNGKLAELIPHCTPAVQGFHCLITTEKLTIRREETSLIFQGSFPSSLM